MLLTAAAVDLVGVAITFAGAAPAAAAVGVSGLCSASAVPSSDAGAGTAEASAALVLTASFNTTCFTALARSSAWRRFAISAYSASNTELSVP